MTHVTCGDTVVTSGCLTTRFQSSSMRTMSVSAAAAVERAKLNEQAMPASKAIAVAGRTKRAALNEVADMVILRLECSSSGCAGVDRCGQQPPVSRWILAALNSIEREKGLSSVCRLGRRESTPAGSRIHLPIKNLSLIPGLSNKAADD